MRGLPMYARIVSWGKIIFKNFKNFFGQNFSDLKFRQTGLFAKVYPAHRAFLQKSVRSNIYFPIQ